MCFRTFPRPKKSAKVRARSRSELAAHSSSSTPFAHGVVSSLEEPVQEEKKEHQNAQEEEEEPVLESAEWVLFRNPTGKTSYWNRRTHSTSWNPPPGIKVVWVGERTKEGGVWYWHRGTRACTYTLPPLPLE